MKGFSVPESQVVIKRKYLKSPQIEGSGICLLHRVGKLERRSQVGPPCPPTAHAFPKSCCDFYLPYLPPLVYEVLRIVTGTQAWGSEQVRGLTFPQAPI